MCSHSTTHVLFSINLGQDDFEDLQKEDEKAQAFAGELEADDELKKFTSKPAVAAKKAKLQRPKLHPERLKEWLPPVPHCFCFYEKGAQRIRVFYSTPSMYRMSLSSSLDKYGLEEGITRCLRWAWQRHLEFTGADCPWSWLVQ